MSDRLDINHAYYILGLQPGATLLQVKMAYRQLVKIWHPDCFPDSEQKQEAEKKIKEINDAYHLLKSYPNESEGTSKSNGTKQHPSSNTSTSNTSKSNTSTRVSGYRADAKTFYEWGVENVNNGNYEEAIADFTRAIRLNPHYMEAYKYRGHVCSLLGYEYRASSDLSKAAQLDRNSNFRKNSTRRSNGKSRGTNSQSRYTQRKSAEGKRVVYQRQSFFKKIWLQIKAWFKSIIK